jgi:hypothetical protein
MRLFAPVLLFLCLVGPGRSQQFPGAFGLKVIQSHSDNIYYQPTHTSDYITEIAPFVRLTLGQPMTFGIGLRQESDASDSNESDINYLNVTWEPKLFLYAKNSFLDVVDEHADAFYAHRFTRLTLGLEQSYDKLSQPTIQTSAAGTLVHRDIFTTTARAEYVVSDDLTTYSTLNQIVSDYQTPSYVNSTEWNADAYFLYQLFPKTSVGFGPRVGYIDISRAPSQTYQSALAHLAYVVSDRVVVTVAAGGEIREFEHDAAPSRLTPIFEVSAEYHPFDSTTITGAAGRHRVVSNNFVGEDYTATTVSATVRQRVLQKCFLTMSTGYENDQYSSASAIAYGQQRDDNFYYLLTGVEWKQADWITLAANYELSRDVSNLSAFSFLENRFSVSATFLY